MSTWTKQTSTRTLVGLKAPRIRPCVMPVAAPKVPYKVLIIRHARRAGARHVMCPNQRLKYMYIALLPAAQCCGLATFTQLGLEKHGSRRSEPSSVTLSERCLGTAIPVLEPEHRLLTIGKPIGRRVASACSSRISKLCYLKLKASPRSLPFPGPPTGKACFVDLSLR